MRLNAIATLCALPLVGVLLVAPDARAYETIRRDSPLGRRLAETARLTGSPVELLLGPHAWKPAPVVRDSAERAARRAAAAKDVLARLDAATEAPPAILFAGPPTLDSLPPRPPGPTLPDSLTGGLLSFAVGDLDGDGLPDLVGVEGAGSTLDVRRNLGGGAYAPAVHYPLANGASKVALGDFNGDGRPDVAVCNFRMGTGRSFSALLNLGDGTLGARSDGDLPLPSSDVFVADLGHDGREDLVFSYSPFAGVAIVLSRADGSFGPAETVAPGTSEDYDMAFPAAAVGDLDGDGNPDIALVYRHGDCFNGRGLELAVFYGRDDRTFEAPATYQAHASSGLFDPMGVDLRDADGDQLADILVSVEGRYEPPRPALIRNAGGRRLEAPTLRSISRTPWTLATGRFRAGRPEDLLVSDDATVTLLRNRGDGSFADEVDLAQGSLLDIVDLDADGLGDVISASGDTIEVRLADGSGGFIAPAAVTAGRYVAIADFDGDHRPDLAVLLPNDHLGILAGDGSGGFGPPQDFGALPGLTFPLRAVDLDGDGLADLAAAWTAWTGSELADSLSVWWGTGRGFTEPSVFDLGPVSTWAHDPMDLQSGDFNGDGRPDLAIVIGDGQDGSTGLVRLLPNLGGRAFGPLSPDLYAGEDPFACVVADFDGDGLDDLAIIAATTDDNGRFLVFKGCADGTLAAVPASSQSSSYLLRHWAFSIAAGDFDGHGRPDVAAGCGALGTSSAPVVLAVPNLTPVLPTTPVLASLVSVQVLPDGVSLQWELGAPRLGIATLERRTVSADWAALASAAPDGSGRVRFDDRSVSAGARYAYRLRLGSGSGSTATSETWVDVPPALAFSLEAARPNPTSGPLAVAFTLPSTARATLDVLDVTGRRVRSRTFEAPAVGRQRLSFGDDGALAPGLYFVRLRQEQRTALTRVAVVR